MNSTMVADALKDVVDPELGINIVALGLLYGVDVQDRTLSVRMTMTTPGCPMAAAIAQMTAARLNTIAEGRDVQIEVVEDPPWSVAMLDDGARKQLGLG